MSDLADGNVPSCDPGAGPPEIQPPPETVPGILSRLGPGLIIAGAIVGSGELITTPKTGAQAGHWLLWLIIIGCVIKVFAQIEFGRYAISSGTTTMAALDQVPGPRLRVNWILWYWLVMFVISLGQLGGIVGGVGQSMAMSLPITGDFNRLLDEQDAWDKQARSIRQELRGQESPALASRNLKIREAVAKDIEQRVAARIGRPRPSWRTGDDFSWAAIFTLVTIGLLFNGRYALVQNVATVLVAGFTVVTVFNLFALQCRPEWAVSWTDLRDGLSFRLPPAVEALARSPLATGLATFGIIGVGTNELISYPYWCLEKGYGRFTGPRDETPQWAERARGWMRVMRWDATVSMFIYTFATVAFYLLGASVLHRSGLDPGGNQMVRTLGEMYVPVFGVWAEWLFLFGAFAVLYSTFFVASASHARVSADAIRVFGIGAGTEAHRIWWVRALCIILPVFSFLVWVFIPKPDKLILASGIAQGMMLPMLAVATLYFRYYRCDKRICPGRLWDFLLWLSAIGLLVAGGWTVLTLLFPALEQLV
ncbi:MAG: Nramp family divalent metal transporter [Pirellulales bacterium]|nr:Nramp family divalent metal transporter [Pirellulales bacterium]